MTLLQFIEILADLGEIRDPNAKIEIGITQDGIFIAVEDLAECFQIGKNVKWQGTADRSGI